MLKARQRCKVLTDRSQNFAFKTTQCIYSIRARTLSHAKAAEGEQPPHVRDLRSCLSPPVHLRQQAPWDQTLTDLPRTDRRCADSRVLGSYRGRTRQLRGHTQRTTRRCQSLHPNFKGIIGFEVVHPAEGTRAWKLQRPSVRPLLCRHWCRSSTRIRRRECIRQARYCVGRIARIIHSGAYLP